MYAAELYDVAAKEDIGPVVDESKFSSSAAAAFRVTLV
jgi:hypothetical protein